MLWKGCGLLFIILAVSSLPSHDRVTEMCHIHVTEQSESDA